MQYHANIANISHDAETGMFEAYVSIEQGGDATYHVVHVPGPISTPFETLQAALIQSAFNKRRNGHFDFRNSRTLTPAAQAYEQAFSGPSALDQLLSRAA